MKMRTILNDNDYQSQ